ncbi:MAG: helix-turn-helix transcriptional regulator, partial [Lachnospiraceae bacterium]|nr:helix-turn-helix transcriptional regulator [Lachnospiraceae bacterium]
MKMMLAENIRRFRKERSLTQEQLSEVLGVTAGAVYKWEAKLSVPDLDLIMEMADFFDTSVDVLLGYEMKDNGLEATVKRLQEYRRRKDRTGLTEAEKALKKYPNSFDVVRECATIYRGFGIESEDEGLFRRALELQERSLLLIGQNTDPEISEQTIYGSMATT